MHISIRVCTVLFPLYIVQSFSKGVENEFEEKQEIATSTPVKAPSSSSEESEIDRIAILKRNIGDTLTFLHQERNDFLPNDDIIIPSRKDDHVSKEINLDSITAKKEKSNLSNSSEALENHDVLRDVAESEVDEVIKTAEEVVNDIKQTAISEVVTDDSLNNLESLKDDSLKHVQQKSEEAFKFLENEASSPLMATFDETAAFVQREKELYLADSTPVKTQKSGIPVSKTKSKIDKEPDLVQDVASTVESDLLSKIPVSAKGKVKTIKKHSKDPLKEFVKLAQDVNWDDDENLVIKTDPIVKTTVKRITSDSLPENLPDNVKSKIPILQNETKTDKSENAKSKIPILVTETTRIISPEVVEIASPGSRVSTLDSDTDSDSPQLQGTIKKNNNTRTVGSSSGSDVALHEGGGELSDEGSGKLLSAFAALG